MSRVFINAYSTASESARLLADALDVWILKHNKSKYVPRPDDLIINWGTPPYSSYPVTTLNRRVSVATNKLNFFHCMNNANLNEIIPPNTTDIQVAREWINNGKTAVCRTVVNGAEGNGIVIANTLEKLVQAPLYTQYIPKDSEWRVHIFKGEIIDIQRKVLKADAPRDNVNWAVRNTANGFVFQRNGINPPQCVKDAAIACFGATGLDFGALDVIYNQRRNKAYVLEINSAPGIEGTTVQNYASAIKSFIANL